MNEIKNKTIEIDVELPMCFYHLIANINYYKISALGEPDYPLGYYVEFHINKLELYDYDCIEYIFKNDVFKIFHDAIKGEVERLCTID